MVDDVTFPVVVGQKPITKLAILAVGIGFFAWGVSLQGSDGRTRVPIFGSVPDWAFGTFVIVLGLLIGVSMVQGLVTGRPTLTIDMEGVAFLPSFGSVRRMPWPEIVSIDAFSSRYARGINIRGRDGRSLRVQALLMSPYDLRDLIIRCGKAAGAPPIDRA